MTQPTQEEYAAAMESAKALLSKTLHGKPQGNKMTEIARALVYSRPIKRTPKQDELEELAFHGVGVWSREAYLAGVRALFERTIAAVKKEGRNLMPWDSEFVEFMADECRIAGDELGDGLAELPVRQVLAFSPSLFETFFNHSVEHIAECALDADLLKERDEWLRETGND